MNDTQTIVTYFRLTEREKKAFLQPAISAPTVGTGDTEDGLSPLTSQAQAQYEALARQIMEEYERKKRLADSTASSAALQPAPSSASAAVKAKKVAAPISPASAGKEEPVSKLALAPKRRIVTERILNGMGIVNSGAGALGMIAVLAMAVFTVFESTNYKDSSRWSTISVMAGGFGGIILFGAIEIGLAHAALTPDQRKYTAPPAVGLLQKIGTRLAYGGLIALILCGALIAYEAYSGGEVYWNCMAHVLFSSVGLIAAGRLLRSSAIYDNRYLN